MFWWSNICLSLSRVDEQYDLLLELCKHPRAKWPFTESILTFCVYLVRPSLHYFNICGVVLMIQSLFSDLRYFSRIIYRAPRLRPLLFLFRKFRRFLFTSLISASSDVFSVFLHCSFVTSGLSKKVSCYAVVFFWLIVLSSRFLLWLSAYPKQVEVEHLRFWSHPPRGNLSMLRFDFRNIFLSGNFFRPKLIFPEILSRSSIECWWTRN